MVRRLVLATVAVVAGALVVAGLGTLVLVQASARREARDELAGQAAAVAEGVREVGLTQAIVARRAGQTPAVRPVLQAIRRALRLQGAELVRLAPTGEPLGALPAGVALDADGVATLLAGGVATGGAGGTVWAAAPVTLRPEALSAVVLTRTVNTGLRPGTRWFAVASGAALAGAVVVAWSLGRRITRPVRAAEAAARRIAGGDLSARVDVPGTGDELDALAGAVNTMAGELERSRRLERQFLMSVSHDLRTPLTSIRGYAEAIADGAAPDPARAGQVIAAESRRLERLVHDLLDLARLDARRFALALGPTDVAAVVAGAVEAFRPAAAAAGLGLTLDAEGALPPASADPERLGQVAGNLLDNALKFAAASVSVSVAADVDGAGVVVAVDDDGPGIPPEELPRVFERLYTAGRAPARAAPGSGLGLAIVRELVEAMGGRVEARSPVPGRAGGTRFVVRLRRWSEVTADPAAAAS